MSSPPSPALDEGNSIFETNPYEGHPSLSPLEAEVLWEYAKLSQRIKDLIAQNRELSEAPVSEFPARLRMVERKMGLAMTLFKVSAWGVINDNEQMIESLESFEAASEADATITH